MKVIATESVLLVATQNRVKFAQDSSTQFSFYNNALNIQAILFYLLLDSDITSSLKERDVYKI